MPAYCVNHGFMTSFYYLDPDGNEVELGVDNFPDNDATNQWFSTGAFDENFFGYFCDPDFMLNRHFDGIADAIVFEETYKDNGVVPQFVAPISLSTMVNATSQLVVKNTTGLEPNDSFCVR